MGRTLISSGSSLAVLLLAVLLPWAQSHTLAAQSIHDAIRAGELETVERLLTQNPALLTVRNEADRDPLHEACIRGQVGIMEFLISRGADVDARSRAENTTLHWAVHAFVGPEVRGEMAASLLTQSPALAKSRNANGLTPLHWSGNELPATIELLLNHGTDPNARDKNGSTALHHWTGWWEDDQSELLINRGADLEVFDNHGRTPLHLAAIVGRQDKYRLLVDAGALLNPRDLSGLTPADYARRFGHHALADLMVTDGALETQRPTPSPTPTLLANGPDSGNAAIWYLDSNAWAVRTENELLIFDYTDWGVMPQSPGMVNGRITGRELRNLSVTVFATSRGSWQENLLSLRDEVDDIQFVLGFLPEDSTGITVMEEEGTLGVGGLSLTSVKSEHGGTAFLVEVDGLKVFHSGMPERFRSGGATAWSRSIHRMKENTGEIDLAFVPIFVTGDSEATAVDGFLEVTEWLQPKVVFPAGGAGTHTYLYMEAGELAQQRWPGLFSGPPKDRGELFEFISGNLVTR